MYTTTLIDSPWPENGGCNRGANYKYKTMSILDIRRTILYCPLFHPADNAHLYMWATNTHLIIAGAMFPELGFRYITCITWPKRRMGIGRYFRGQTEHLLFGVRGNGWSVRQDSRCDLTTLLNFWDHPHRKHSAKPPSAHELIEARSKGPYAELFARERREGWECWGDELGVIE